MIASIPLVAMIVQMAVTVDVTAMIAESLIIHLPRMVKRQPSCYAGLADSKNSHPITVYCRVNSYPIA
jgi:hypothetical protein